jgi:hypothetical protein
MASSFAQSRSRVRRPEQPHRWFLRSVPWLRVTLKDRIYGIDLYLDHAMKAADPEIIKCGNYEEVQR